MVGQNVMTRMLEKKIWYYEEVFKTSKLLIGK